MTREQQARPSIPAAFSPRTYSVARTAGTYSACAFLPYFWSITKCNGGQPTAHQSRTTAELRYSTDPFPGELFS